MVLNNIRLLKSIFKFYSQIKFKLLKNIFMNKKIFIIKT